MSKLERKVLAIDMEVYPGQKTKSLITGILELR